MGNWKKHLREIASRDPNSLPDWLRGGTQDAAWYRASWQIDAGIDPDAAARPARIMLGWLERRGLLSRNGAVRQADEGRNLSISRSMVSPEGAAFLDHAWESWWQLHGINLTLSGDNCESACAAIEESWVVYGSKIVGQ